ncbi:MAG: hypothetical protein JNL47_09295 [Bacteroidia bacterium]|nr:hypothetical protein [Bacteroidia bacterium]
MSLNKKLAGWTTILSGIIAFISYTLVAAAVNFNFEFFSDATLIFSTEGVSSILLRWSMITDIFGYYLLLLPVLFLIYEWMKTKTAWAEVFTTCGGIYIIAGAAGAAILGSAWPALLDKYQAASPEQQEIIRQNFETLALVIVNGIWNLLDALMFGVWFIAFGFLLKKQHVFLGWFTLFTGLCSAFDFTGNMLGIKAIADTALNLYLVLAPLWAIVFGVALLRNPSLLKTN